MDIGRLLTPRSIAVLGASDSPSLGRSMIESLGVLGFDGDIYPVNPKYDAILGRRCYRSLRDLPASPDVVTFCVGLKPTIDLFPDLALCGAGAAVIYGGGFAEHGADGERVQARLTDIAREAGVALCGPNCMGVINPIARSSTFLQPVRDPAGLAGPVGFVTQSGSIAGCFLADLRRHGFSLVASSGNEAVLSAAAFIEYMARDPHTRVIAAFLESVREPERFVAALDLAASLDKPVIVLKVGKSEAAQRQIQSHTGGLAGQAHVFSAVLRAHRAIEVATLSEMTEQIAACLVGPRPKGRRVAVVTTSGGQAELILDLASAGGVPMPPLDESLRAECGRNIEGFSGPGNPLDAWGVNGAFLPSALKLLSEHDAADSIVFCGADCLDESALGRPGRDTVNAHSVAAAARASDKPHFFMTTRQGVISKAQVAILNEAGVPVIGGTELGLAAIDRLARWSAPARTPRGRTWPQSAELTAQRQTINEFDSKRLLARHGLPVTRERLVATEAQARAAADAMGYPVVLKVVSDAIPHKSEHGLVAVGLADAQALTSAFATMQHAVARLGQPIEGFLVQEMVSGGIEVFAGVSRDPQFGLTIAFGMGGVAIEQLRDFALRALPLREGEAEEMIAEPRGAALLRAFRGRPACDVAALADCLYALSDFACANARVLREIDLNPIKVRREGQGCVIVDALIVCE